jgi:hypothetical protein
MSQKNAVRAAKQVLRSLRMNSLFYGKKFSRKGAKTLSLILQIIFASFAALRVR